MSETTVWPVRRVGYRRGLQLVIPLLLVGVSPLLGAPEAAQFVQRSWTDKQGLPGNQVWAVVQDRDGYIWVGTNSGLARFDGVRFDHTVGDPDLPIVTVRALCAAADGSLWVGFGGAGGISRLRDGAVTNYDADEGIPPRLITALVQDHEGTVWASSGAGVSRFRGNRWQRMNPEFGLPNAAVQSLHVDRRGAVWVASSIGVFRRQPHRDTFEQVSPAVVSAFSDDRLGVLWTTDPKDGFRKLDDDGAEASAPVLRVAGSRLHHDAAGALWVGTTGRGLFRLTWPDQRRAFVQRLGTEHGLTSDTIRSLMTDGEGSLWVGTDNGLTQLSRSIFTSLPPAGEAWRDRLVRGVVSSDGDVWVATVSGLYQFADRFDRPVDWTHRLTGASIISIYADEETVWVGTDRGVVRFRHDRFSSLRPPSGVHLNGVTAMTTDSRGNLWLWDRGAGLFNWNTGGLEHVALPSHFHERSATALFADRQDRVWIGFLEGGVAVRENGRFRTYEPADGIAGGTVTGFYQDRDGLVWVAAVGGVTRVKGDLLLTATRSNGLPGNAAIGVTGDENGLWLGTNLGVVHVARAEFTRLERDSAHQLGITLFTSADGVSGNPIALGSTESVRAADGTIWVATTEGVVVVDPREANKRRLPPPVKIEGVRADQQQIDLHASNPLASHVSRLEIAYAGLTFVAPSTVRFRYRLEGFDRGWVDAGSERRAVYTGLPPGSYRFRVTANNDGVWNETGDDWTFSVAPAFYQTRWFGVGSVIGFLVLLSAGWHVRARRLRAKFQLVLEERARVGREIHDTLLQTLLGVAFEIHATAEALAPEHVSVREYLVRLREHVQKSIRETRQAIWDLRRPGLLDERSFLTALRQTCETIVANAKGVRFEFVVTGSPRKVPEVDEQLLRLAQEAVRNAARHADASSIRVEVHYGDDAVVLKVIDDGSGFDVDAARLPSLHWGLVSMEERAKAIGAEFRVLSRPGAGTEIEAVARL